MGVIIVDIVDGLFDIFNKYYKMRELLINYIEALPPADKKLIIENLTKQLNDLNSSQNPDFFKDIIIKIEILINLLEEN